MSSGSLDLRSMCRTCMSNRTKFSSGPSVSKFKRYIYEKPAGWNDGPTLVEILRAVQPEIQIHIKDKLPKIMCNDCIVQLQMAYEFLRMCKDSDEKFRKMLKETSDTPHDDQFGDDECLLEKVEIGDTHFNEFDNQPQFESMYVSNWSEDDENDTVGPDFIFGNDSDEEDGSPTDTRKRKNSKSSMPKEHKTNNKKLRQNTDDVTEGFESKNCGKDNIDNECANCKRLEQKLNDLEESINTCSRKIARLEESNKKKSIKLLRQNVSNSNEGIVTNKFVEENNEAIYKTLINFPIASRKILQTVEDNIGPENHAIYVSAIATLLGNNLTKNLQSILHIEIVMNYNIDGTHGKERLKDFEKFYCALLEMLDLLRKIDEAVTILNSKTYRSNKAHGGIFSEPNIMPIEPFTTLEQYEDLENRLQNEDTFNKFVNEVCTIQDKSCDKFVRKAWKQIFTDQLAEQFSWRGTNTKKGIKTTRLLLAIRQSFKHNFDHEDDEFVDRLTQKHFHYAHDRLSKSTKYYAKKLKVEDDPQES